MKLQQETYSEYRQRDNYVDRDSVYVTGALALLLRLSRWAGVAPLHVRREGAGWRVTVSPTLVTLERVVMTLLNIIFLTALILDFCQEHTKSVRVGATFMDAFLWVLDLVLVMLYVSLAVYAGPARMESLKRVLKQWQQIKTALNASDPHAKTERNQSIAIVVTLIWTATVASMAFYLKYRRKVHDNTTCIILSLYGITYYLGNLWGLLVVLQWCGEALTAHAAVAAINDNLQQLRHSYIMPETIPGLEHILRSRMSVNSVVDRITRLAESPVKEFMGYEFLTYPSQAQATIHRLTLSNNRLNQMIRDMSDVNGWIVMTILASTSFRLILTGYYVMLERGINHFRISGGISNILAFVFARKGNPILVNKANIENKNNGLFGVIIHLGWGVFLMTTLILLIEPCHRTQTEKERTEVLLSHLIVYLAPECELLSKELDQFAKQLLLDNAKFIPLGVYTLARPLMAMILGSVTTFLVIVIQFQKVSNVL